MSDDNYLDRFRGPIAEPYKETNEKPPIRKVGDHSYPPSIQGEIERASKNPNLRK